MTVEARIGKFTLLDEIDNGTDRDSMLRKLISNEGDDLADFKYQSFCQELMNTTVQFFPCWFYYV